MASLQISERNRCAFVHIPKTGGTSVERSALFADVRCGGHTGVQDFLKVLGARRTEFYLFTFVRNPWDRLVSAFEYMSRGGGTGGDKAISDEYLRRFNGNFGEFVEALTEEPDLLNLEHFRPQIKYVENDQGYVEVDYIGRFERLSSDFDQICARVGCQGTRLQHLRTKGHNLGVRVGIRLLNQLGVPTRKVFRRDYRKWFTDRTVILTAQTYERDATAFGYTFE